jgi:hypothetical protein
LAAQRRYFAVQWCNAGISGNVSDPADPRFAGSESPVDPSTARAPTGVL